MSLAEALVDLQELTERLRRDCPWDREQTERTIVPHTVEEAYEVADAAVARDDAKLADELGDLLFQVYFHSVLAAEAGRFTLADVARGVHDKLVARHPHVFGDAEAHTPAEVMATWEVRKLAEKDRTSVTEGIPASLPALALAAKLQRKAIAVGMVLPDVAAEAVGVAEGVARLAAAADGAGDGAGDDAAASGPAPDTAAELGALLFSVVNVGRALGVEPETALRARDAAFRRSVEALG